MTKNISIVIGWILIAVILLSALYLSITSITDINISSLAAPISILIIAAVLVFFMLRTRKISKISKVLQDALNSDNILENLRQTSLQPIVEQYEASFNIDVDGKKKSNIPASEFFNAESICSYSDINLRLLDTGSGTLVGLGLLGTFLGLTIGISGFDSSNSENIQSSIQGLLSGMGTAFITSLVGMGFSIIYLSFFDKPLRNQFTQLTQQLINKLDADCYIDDIALMQLNQQEMMNAMLAKVTETISAETASTNEALSKLAGMLTYDTEDGHTSTVGTAIREVLSENQQQSKALKSFSTDLAIELNNGFDTVLDNQLRDKIIPLMNNVDTTTKAIIDHIDSMAASVANPATDMMEKIVDELKTTMANVVDEFRQNVSQSATAELEKLAVSLSSATQAMGTFPQEMDNISRTLQTTITEIKQAITDISQTSAQSNSSAMQQMQEQIAYATTAISNSITEVKHVMSEITNSSQLSSNEIVSRITEASERMSKFMETSISQVAANLKASVQSISDDVASKQEDLLVLQESTTAETKKLLEIFNAGLERMGQINEAVNGTISQFQEAQGQIVGSTAHLQSITSSMKSASTELLDSQRKYASQIEKIQSSSTDNIDRITELLTETDELGKEHAEQYAVIREALSGIFAQLQNGLKEYSRTVQASTRDYLEKFTQSLTNTTDALKTTIQQQNDVVEMLSDAINAHRK